MTLLRASPEHQLLSTLKSHLEPLQGDKGDYDSLLDMIGPARFALLGDASHGTYEFYRERAAITRRLILEKDFTAVAVEADWPDAWRVNRYVRGLPGDADADQALSGFQRFPSWMWRNAVMLDFVEWLREHNKELPPARQVGFYGMDLYSLSGSIQSVLAYLDTADPQAAQRARNLYACFDHAGEEGPGKDPGHGYAGHFGISSSRENEVVHHLLEMNRRTMQLPPGRSRDDVFFAQQNARLVKNADAYYRAMFRGRVPSWNLRDSHMVETLNALDNHLRATESLPRIAVWAHNAHLGDAVATETSEHGEWNVGQLMRDQHPQDTRLVGFSTHHGWVTAASGWDVPPERMKLAQALPGSWEDLFRQTGTPNFLLQLRGKEFLRESMAAPRLQRSIGVVYRQDTERVSHYLNTHLAEQFDAVIHFGETTALVPLPAPNACSEGTQTDGTPAN